MYFAHADGKARSHSILRHESASCAALWKSGVY